MSEMASHEPFGHSQHKLWSKEGPGVKLAVWLPTTKSRESTRSRCVQSECDTSLKSSQGELQVRFRPRPNRRLEWEVMNAQSPESLNRDNFGTPKGLHFGSPRTKSHSGVGVVEQRREYYMGGRWWLPPSPGRGESSESKVARGLSQHQKGAEWVLTNLWLVLDAGPSK
jgi:hypothetical protein